MLNVTNLCGFGGNSTKPWSYVSVGAAATGANPQPGLPSGIEDGDLLIIFIANDDTTIPTPTGWTLLSNLSTTLDVNVYGRISDGSATDNPTISTTSTLSRTVMFAMRNIQNNPYVDVVGTHDYQASQPGSMTTSSITTNYDNEPVISFFALQDNDATESWTAPAGTTTIYNAPSGVTINGLLIVYETQEAKGASTARAATFPGTADHVSALAIAFRQAT